MLGAFCRLSTEEETTPQLSDTTTKYEVQNYSDQKILWRHRSAQDRRHCQRQLYLANQVILMQDLVVTDKYLTSSSYPQHSLQSL